MSRTESKSIQVHPNNEQSEIDQMQKFHWSLLNSQEIKTIDNHLEQRGDDIYSVTKSEQYVKLTFSRALDLPNLESIRKLEADFFSLRSPPEPPLFPVSVWLWLVAAFFYGLGIVGWIVYYVLSYKPKCEAVAKLRAENESRRTQILSSLAQYG